MYGQELTKKLPELKKHKNLLVIVGGEKVPPEIYQLTDFNIAITQQPISEVSALAVLLHLLNNGKELENNFKGKIRILDSEKGKKILSSK